MDSPQKPSGSQEDGSTPNPPQSEQITKIQQLLSTKDDTSRFVGLALLKSTLDNSGEIREDKEVILALWGSISAKFLDRLLRTGAKPGSKQADAREMLDLATNVIYTFTVLLPAEAHASTKLVGRIPRLIEAVLSSSGETTDNILKTLLTLVSNPEGGRAFSEAEDWTPLIEIAPKQPHALAILSWSWLYAASATEDRASFRDRIDKTIFALIASYKGTDAVTLLDFIDKALGRLDDDLIPANPQWLGPLIELIRNLATARPTAAGREAYTNCTARILITYSDSVPRLLFRNESSDSSNPFSYLFISLIIVDLKATLPSLLSKLNTPEYPSISTRLTSGLLVLSYFISFLLQQMDAQINAGSGASSFADAFQMPPDLLLKLNKSISETLSIIMEYLRDRWDAAVAGAYGLHPEARSGESHTAAGSHLTLAWDQQDVAPAEDPLLLAALRVLGEWIREDDGEVLRNEAITLMDLLVELYQTSSGPSGSIGYRALVLGVLQGVTQTDDGIRVLLEHNGWSTLSKDMLAALNRPSVAVDLYECELGSQVALLLMTLTENQSATSEEWLDLVTGIAAYDVPNIADAPEPLQRFWADMLQLAADLLANTTLGVRRRYEHTAASVRGIAATVKGKITSTEAQKQLEEAIAILAM
ncbi:hypothetical protein PG996_002386 [Apiospora saccharicola]|uniref:DUF1941 family protein n=1 Tax=Apiospora saccharicola TaxID=335842 RepID=A0ABR1WJB5_9PEZI